MGNDPGVVRAGHAGRGRYDAAGRGPRHRRRALPLARIHLRRLQRGRGRRGAAWHAPRCQRRRDRMGDGFHTASSILFSADDTASTALRALGHYGNGAGGPDRGWRTGIDQPDADTVVITTTNITPDGQESRAVETRYSRVDGWVHWGAGAAPAAPGLRASRSCSPSKERRFRAAITTTPFNGPLRPSPPSTATRSCPRSRNARLRVPRLTVSPRHRAWSRYARSARRR